ncbi:hypothetical protein ElyMa_001676500 [Elysia marginata]|uniref:Uncharacterized protein n=1 Tax=Elysia marginata TaxID=1093978 RepID=A0AAV4JUD6_9GAST|nr:hypothetical protein ElyMa_001676500 [Elysia marginata]
MVVESIGPLSYKTKTNSHGIVRRYQDQIRVSLAHDSDPVDTPVTNDDSNSHTQIQIQNPTNERLEVELQNYHSLNKKVTIDVPPVPTLYHVPPVREQEHFGTGSNNGENTNPEDPEEQTLTQPLQVAVDIGNQPYVTRSGRVVKPPVR